MRVRSGMRFGSRRDCVQQKLQTVFGLHVIEIRAVGAEFSEQGRVVCGHALTDNRDSQAWEPWWLGRQGRSQAIRIVDRGGAKGIELMRTPEVSRELLDKLRRRVYPIRMF